MKRTPCSYVAAKGHYTEGAASRHWSGINLLVRSSGPATCPTSLPPLWPLLSGLPPPFPSLAQGLSSWASSLPQLNPFLNSPCWQVVGFSPSHTCHRLGPREVVGCPRPQSRTQAGLVLSVEEAVRIGPQTLTSARAVFFWAKPEEEKGDFRLAAGSPIHRAHRQPAL